MPDCRRVDSTRRAARLPARHPRRDCQGAPRLPSSRSRRSRRRPRPGRRTLMPVTSSRSGTWGDIPGARRHPARGAPRDTPVQSHGALLASRAGAGRRRDRLAVGSRGDRLRRLSRSCGCRADRHRRARRRADDGHNRRHGRVRAADRLGGAAGHPQHHRDGRGLLPAGRDPGRQPADDGRGVQAAGVAVGLSLVAAARLAPRRRRPSSGWRTVAASRSDGGPIWLSSTTICGPAGDIYSRHFARPMNPAAPARLTGGYGRSGAPS